jgi:hypothetical protein
MDRDRVLELVKGLTRPVVEAFCPGELATFEADFAAWALTAGVPRAAEKAAVLKPRDQGLDTTLVAGMFFQVMLEASRLPATTPERVSFVRQEAKNYLVSRLAGQITLSQFYRLLSLIEEKAGAYFAALEGEWAGLRPGPREEPQPRPEAVRGEELRRALAELPLPQKGRRKLTPETLWQFLRNTAGAWFRLLDLEAHFRVNKKTAWSYLHLLLQAGILEHNGEKANRVRYALAPRFKAESP